MRTMSTMSTTSRRVALTLALAAALLPEAARAAQWLNYKVPGVPRTKDGAVDVNAPAPRMGPHPDLSGLWAAEDNRPCPPGGCADMKVGQEFFNIGWSVKGGLPYQPWAGELMKQRTKESRLHDPISYCLPSGIVRLHTQPLMRKMIQTPALMTI